VEEVGRFFKAFIVTTSLTSVIISIFVHMWLLR
jgi:hypothetical protein